MDVTEKHVARIPPGHLLVTRREFAAVWREAERRRYAAEVERRYEDEWYGAAVAETCRWIACAGLRRPATGRDGLAYEELIEEEAVAAENLGGRRPTLARLRPGWCEGIRDTLRWAWWFAGPPPVMVPEPEEPVVGGIEVTAERLAFIPSGTFRVPREEFVAVWTDAENRRGARGRPDWYVDGVVETCRWLAGASYRPPATGRMRPAVELWVEAEAVESETLRRRQPTLARLRPGWCEGIRDTFTWAWRATGPPPILVAGQGGGSTSLV